MQFVPNLAHNLVSIRKVIDSGYSDEFSKGECIIKEGNSMIKVAQVSMTKHRLFPFHGDDVHHVNIAEDAGTISELWHKRYGHLNMKNLKNLVDH